MGWVPTEAGLLELAERAARIAGRELMSRWGREPVGVRTKSSPTDPVSAADLAAERAIREVIAAERPDDAILGEEGGESVSGTGWRWVVDPLDGTVNFLYGIPLFAVSVACEDGEGSLVGVVLDPVRDECFAASRSGPATLNGEPIRPDRGDCLAHSLVATGFAYDPDIRAAQARVIERLLPRVRDIRRGGAAALDLCWCACGRVDAYFERGVRVWDVAAGALLCARAGLSVRRLAPVRNSPDAGLALPDGLLVAAPAIIDELGQLVAE
jgi:myo-inositol-1(or 4)-monophosphatase